jgi:hypothetical protein
MKDGWACKIRCVLGMEVELFVTPVMSGDAKMRFTCARVMFWMKYASQPFTSVGDAAFTARIAFTAAAASGGNAASVAAGSDASCAAESSVDTAGSAATCVAGSAASTSTLIAACGARADSAGCVVRELLVSVPHCFLWSQPKLPKVS